MRKYTTPEMEIIKLETEDVIAASNGLNTGGEGTFDDEIEWT